MSNTGTLATQICDSLRRSTTALYGVDLKGLTKDERESIGVTAYANCREQGYTVRIVGRTNDDSFQCAFAEERGGDRMVLYVGRPSDFDSQCAVPREAIYERAEYFKSEKAISKRIAALVKDAARDARHSYR